MLISIIVPSFNQGRYIRQTLDSILSQDYRPLEVLVIDGASTDDTVEVLRSYDVPELQWWSEPDKGVVEAVNKGLARAKGAIIGIQSSDDLYLPGALSAIASEFTRDRELALVYGDVEYIDAQSRVTSRTELPPFDLHEYIGKITFIPQPAAFFTAEAAQAVGPWREDVSYAADAEFFLRVAVKYRLRKIDRLLARYRYHESQRDKESSRVPGDWAKVMEPFTRDPNPLIRRQARGSIWMVRHRYARPDQWARSIWYVYRMLLANPALFRRTDKRLLIPGRDPIWKLLSRVKQALRRR